MEGFSSGRRYYSQEQHGQQLNTIPNGGKEKMSSRKSLSVMAMLVFAGMVGVSAVNAQDSACQYTLASLKGTYAVVNTYGSNQAMGLQIEILDGNGNLTRTGFLNQPKSGSTTGERTTGRVTSNGTYTVNCNGTGTIARVVTRPDGTKAAAYDDFIITQAAEGSLHMVIALSFQDMQRDPSVIIPGGVFITRVHTRLPELNYFSVPAND
jgi:hypothetical protein